MLLIVIEHLWIVGWSQSPLGAFICWCKWDSHQIRRPKSRSNGKNKLNFTL
jgi:hypothetical protein